MLANESSSPRRQAAWSQYKTSSDQERAFLKELSLETRATNIQPRRNSWPAAAGHMRANMAAKKCRGQSLSVVLPRRSAECGAATCHPVEVALTHALGGCLQPADAPDRAVEHPPKPPRCKTLSTHVSPITTGRSRIGECNFFPSAGGRGSGMPGGTGAE